MKTTTKDFDISGFLPYRINILANRISNELSAIYSRKFGITIPEWRTLSWLKSNKMARAKEIAFHCVMDKTQVSRVVASLEKRDLLKRTMEKNDQRCYQLQLTSKGEALVEKIIPEALSWEKQFIASLSKEEYAAFFQVMENLESQISSNE